MAMAAIKWAFTLIDIIFQRRKNAHQHHDEKIKKTDRENWGEKGRKMLRHRMRSGADEGPTYERADGRTRFLDAFSHLYERVCLSVRPSVRHTRVEFMRNETLGLYLNKMASGILTYAIRKTIQIQVR